MNKDKLKDILGINKNDCVSIVGAGGKTTMMFKLAEELKNEKVCVTTTTKIFVPEKFQYDYFFKGEILDNTLKSEARGVYVITGDINEKGKLTPLNGGTLDKCFDNFDYMLIESDGSRGKSIKGWNDNEPVIYINTTKTVCIVDVSIVDKEITEDNVFRLDEFRKITSPGETVGISHLSQMANHPNGLLKNSLGERILFVNKVESEREFDNASKLVTLILSADAKCSYDKIIIGSLKSGEYYTAYNDKNIAAIILASGNSARMGSDKLRMNFKGMYLVEHILKKISTMYFYKKMIIVRDDKLNDIAYKYNVLNKKNIEFNLGQSQSIKIGVKNSPEADSYMLFVGDQPFIKSETILKMISKYNETDNIIMCRCNNHFGNPAIFPSRYKGELLELSGDVGAKSILNKHKSEISFVEVEEIELFDIDTIEELKKF